MALNIGDSRKRKMREMAEMVAQPPQQQDANFHTFQRQQFDSHTLTDHLLNNNAPVGRTWKRQSSGGFNGHYSSQATLNNGAHFFPPMQSQEIHIGQPAQSQTILEFSKPFKSFTALLTEDDHAPEDNMNVIIKHHGEELRCTVSEMSRKHYNTLAFTMAEKASKKLKEKDMQVNQVMIKNAELNQMVMHFRQEAQAAQDKVKSLQNLATSLMVSLNEAKMRNSEHNNVGIQVEDAESSSTDPDSGVEPIRLACKACDKTLATMMLWPCRHVALCASCDAIVNFCPVCRNTKSMLSLEVVFP